MAENRISMEHLLPINNEGIGDEELAFAASVRTWAEREVISRRQSLRGDLQSGAADRQFDLLLRPALRSLMLDLGLQTHLWPGDGQSPPEAAMTLALALEQVGRADAGLGFVATSYLATAAAAVGRLSLADVASLLCPAGDEAIVALVLPSLSQDEGRGPFVRSAHPPHRTTIGGWRLQAWARLEGGDYVVQGQNVQPLGSGQDATLFAVLCQLDGDGLSAPPTRPTGPQLRSSRPDGALRDEAAQFGLLLVPADAAGVRRGAAIRRTGLAAARNAPVSFEAAGARLALEGPEGHNALRTWLCLGMAATCSGALLAGLEILEGWAESRVIKGRGQRFVDNSLVAALMAEQVERATLARLALRDLARLMSRAGRQGDEPVLLTALTIAHHVAAQAAAGLGHAMELMGSAGYATEWNLERCWRDVRTLQALIGSPVLHRLELARHCFGHREGM